MKLYKIAIFSALCNYYAFFQTSFAQAPISLSGIIFSIDKSTLANATIIIKVHHSTKILAWTISSSDGTFLLNVSAIQPGLYDIEIEHISYSTLSLTVNFDGIAFSPNKLITRLSPKVHLLDSIKVKAEVKSFYITRDTIEYKALAYRNYDTRKIADLLRNIPGFAITENGKIAYNGKEIETILIDGEDLTGNAYQLISKNLNAGVVDKIQVLLNYQKDRLMKVVDNSGQVGINLKIDKLFKNKLSGSIEAGYGTEQKSVSDENIIYLKNKLKLLLFSSQNNIGISSSEDLRYQIGQDESSDYSNVELNNKNKISESRITQVQAKDEYININKDAAIVAIAGGSFNKAVKLKIITGFNSHNQLMTAESNDQTFLNNGDAWQIISKENQRIRNLYYMNRISLEHDNSKRNTGRYQIELIKNSDRISFSNISTIAISDSLSELLRNKDINYRIKGDESIQLSKNKLLTCQFRISKINKNQDLLLNTTRLPYYFSLDSSYTQNNELLRDNMNRQSFNLTLHGKSTKYSFQFGLNLNYGQNNTENSLSIFQRNTTSSNVRFPNERSVYTVSTTSIFLLLSRALRNNQYSIELSSTYGKSTFINRQNIEKKITSIPNIFLSYQHSFSELKILKLQFQFDNSLPGAEWYFPKKLISGNVSILFPSNSIELIGGPKLSFSYISNNLYTNSQFILSSVYSTYLNAFSTSLHITPYYSISDPIIVHNSSQFLLRLAKQNFIPAIKTKLITSLQFSRINQRTIVNEIIQDYVSNSVQSELKIITGIKFPVNFETAFRLNYAINVLHVQSAKNQLNNLCQYQGYHKLKFVFGEHFYSAILNNYYLFTGHKYYNFLDVFLVLKMRSNFGMSLTIHNILKNNTISQKFISANSILITSNQLAPQYYLLKVSYDF